MLSANRTGAAAIGPIPFVQGEAVRVADYIPPVIAEVICAHHDRAWVRWPNGTDAIVPVASLERAL